MKKFISTITFIVISAVPLAASPKPNVVVILVDDMGFSDLGCYGSEIPTPNLDALAADGLRFTQFYNAGRCTPTRAALLTGLYGQQTGIGTLTQDEKLPGYRGRLNDQCATLAEVLGSAGYFTAISGKWHLGQEHGVTPWGRGFQRNLSAVKGGFYQPGNGSDADLWLNGEAIEDRDPRLPADWYTTDLWTTFGLKFIDEALAEKKPFFLYLAHNAPHFPVQAPAEEIAKFRGKYKIGWDALRQARYEKLVDYGIIDKDWALSKRPEGIAAWDSLSEKVKDQRDHQMAVYAACVSRLDRSIGDLVAGLKKDGVFDNTIILVMSDNGGSGEPGPDGMMSGDPTQKNSRWFVGANWAHAQDTPFYRYKKYNDEGGIATPLIVHWPNGISAKGELRKEPGHVIDIMPTLVELAGAEYPATLNGKDILPMEGRSLVPAFTDQPIQRDALFWEHVGNAAIRVGDRKLVREGTRGDWRLYDMAKDRTEQNNLADSHPEEVATLAAKWDTWAHRAQVLPSPRSKGNKTKKEDK